MARLEVTIDARLSQERARRARLHRRVSALVSTAAIVLGLLAAAVLVLP